MNWKRQDKVNKDEETDKSVNERERESVCVYENASEILAHHVSSLSAFFFILPSKLII